MSRRSSRLASGGYYHSEDESDSSSVTNITYRENPVKVFKKKAGTRKVDPRTSSRANSDANSANAKTSVAADECEGMTPPPAPSRTLTYVPSVVTPRPALTPSSIRGHTPSRCPPVPQAGPRPPVRPGPPPTPTHQEPSQRGVDSSGYSSSEGPHRKPPTATTSRSSGPPSTVTDSVSSLAVRTRKKLTHLAASSPSIGTVMKISGLLLLLLLVVTLSVWLLPPLTSPASSSDVPDPPTQSGPVAPTTPPPLDAVHPVAVDPTVVSAAVDAKLQGVLEELRRRQEELLSQVKESLQRHLLDVEAKLGGVAQDGRTRLEAELRELSEQLEDRRAESRSAAADLSRRVGTLEVQNAKLLDELSSVQPTPPCPEASVGPAPDRLTPELRVAMETWFTEHMKERDAVLLASGGRCSDPGGPAADRMADFALETQGASVISTRCSETYRSRSACVSLFGVPLWYPYESPRTVIQGHPVLLPGKCWAFHGVQGTLVISLSHPIRISHVTLDHLPRCNSPTGRIDSAPKDFEVYGMKNDTVEGALLGGFTYDQDGPPTQTFQLPNPSGAVHRLVELRVLTNWGHVEYTCVYRFRVHGQIPPT
ncbi:SUN domain-containing protein 1-like [Antennarius striatus]|uniref:SUN domain-containing protein 1-like n=1 Tax=Antennarius striatus TaxID=241820 RepID=UPI0035B45EF1